MAENPNAMAGYPYDGCGPDPTPEERANDALEEVRTYLSWVPPDHAEAAHDALLAAESERAELEADRDGKGFVRDMAEAALRKCESERAELAREVERLRKALTLTYESIDNLCARPGTCMAVRPRAALSKPTEGEPDA